MSMSSVGASSNAYAYLQSLLQQGSTKNSDASGAADPLTELLAAFYPAGAGDQAGSSTAASTSTAAASSAAASPPCPPFSPDTMGALISAQEQQSGATGSPASRAKALFGQFDANGDGQISKSEFESVFGSNADVSKVDGLFGALDSNGDGSVSQDELASAAQASRGHHHHMHGSGSGQTGGLADLLSAADAAGATSQTATNADGSTTTTISYADGSKISMTLPTTPTGASSSDGSGGQSATSSTNVIERLIRLQSEMIAQSANATMAPT